MFRKLIANMAIRVKSPQSLKYAYYGRTIFKASRSQLVEEQRIHIEQLCIYAYHHTKYYREIFDDIKLLSNDRVDWSKFCEVPILTKDIIRERGTDLISDEAKSRGCYKNTSGGSTGKPVIFVQDKQYYAKNFGNIILFGILNGKYPGDKEIKLWGSERDIFKGSIGLRDKIINLIFNRMLLNSFILNDTNMKEYITKINNYKPKQIWAYADSIYQLSKYSISNNLQMYCPQNIVTTAGVLYSDMRKVIQRAFPKSNILNQYGSRETGLIGCEVGNGKKGIRIFEHSVLLEVMDTNRHILCDSGMGELIVTNLNNYSMPLIRYQIGDIGKIDEYHENDGCFKVLSELTGRTNTHIIKEDGTLVHGEYFTHLFYHRKWISNFQVIQHMIDSIEIKIVISKDMQPDEKDIADILHGIEVVMGKISVNILYCDEIPKLKSGKYQFVITEIE